MKQVGKYRCFVFASVLPIQWLPVAVTASSASFKPPVFPKTAVSTPAPIPDFGSIPDVKIKKSKFFDYLIVRTRIANDRIWAERQYVIDFQGRFEGGGVSPEHQAGFETLASRYNMTVPEVRDQAFFVALLRRVDVVPASLVLAQGAKESAWGTSRFGVEGRNFFGVWCYQAGCGLKPRSRAAGAKHEVRKFKTVLEGVAFYIHNINIGHAYEDLRLIREQLRAEGDDLSGIRLADGLIKYSERREAYVSEIKALIRQNKLSRFNLRRDAVAIQSDDVRS
jgi:Bax protein